VATSALVSGLFRWLFCSNRHGNSDERVHVQASVNMGDMGERVVRVTQHAIDLADVMAIVTSHHDGIKGR